MQTTRRQITVFGAAAVLLASPSGNAAADARPSAYGRIGQILTAPGKRDELAAVLIGASVNMPGCLSYIIASDPAKEDALWITEVWTDKQSHANSLQLPAVQAAISKGRPMIVGFANSAETVPIGGIGLDRL